MTKKEITEVKGKKRITIAILMPLEQMLSPLSSQQQAIKHLQQAIIIKLKKLKTTAKRQEGPIQKIDAT